MALLIGHACCSLGSVAGLVLQEVHVASAELRGLEVVLLVEFFEVGVNQLRTKSSTPLVIQDARLRPF